MNGIKNALRPMVNFVRARWWRFWSLIDRPLAWLFSFSFLGSAIYYFFLNFQFQREQRAVLQGRRRYFEEEKSPDKSSALLRRNTHRLEKGLLMRPRRDIFALDYIEETFDCYQKMLTAQQSELDKCGSQGFPELQWAHDVLKKYFAETGANEKLDRLRKKFAELPSVEASASKFIPYCRAADSQPKIEFEEMHRLAKYRRSVRWYLDKPVPRELVDKAIEVGGLAPSACNRQPFYFHVVDDPELLKKVVNLPMGTVGYSGNIPMMIVVVGRMRNYPFERDRHLIYIDGSLASMSLIYALEVQGLSTCCINWPDIEAREKKMARVLKLDGDERPVMCISVGYPDPEGMVAYSSKKPLDVIRKYNHE